MTYGGVTDRPEWQEPSSCPTMWGGQRYRARLGGTYYRYLYNGERVLEELSDGGTMQARYTTEDDSYYGSWLHLYRPSGSLSRFPLYDAIGTARMLVDGSATITDTYHLDAWGHQFTSTGTTPNPYRFGAAWGYITDPSGFLQLGQRFYWPEVGRFISKDPVAVVAIEVTGYHYGGNNPVVYSDPTGLLKICWSQYRTAKSSTEPQWGPWQYDVTCVFTVVRHWAYRKFHREGTRHILETTWERRCCIEIPCFRKTCGSWRVYWMFARPQHLSQEKRVYFELGWGGAEWPLCYKEYPAPHYP